MKNKCLLFVVLIAALYPVTVQAQATKEVGVEGGGGSSSGGGSGLSSTSAITTGVGLKNGKVWIWGFRGSGQQGNESTIVDYLTPPTAVESLENIIFVAGGAYHLLALDRYGVLRGWGQNGYGEVGCGTTAYINKPCKINFSAPIVQVAAGEYFSIALDNNGTVWTWGHNLYGQLGANGSENSKIPVKVNLKGERARLIGGAYEGGFAVTMEGHVWGWGDNEASGLGFQGTSYGVQKVIRTPTRAPKLEPYASQMVFIAGGNGWGEALLKDGTVIGWGVHASLGQGTTSTSTSGPDPVIVMKNVKQLQARYVGSIALTNDDEVYTWGQTGGSAFNIYGANPTKRQTAPGRVVLVGHAKESVTYQLEDGSVYGVGYNSLGVINSEVVGTIDWPGIRLKDIPD